MRRRLSRASVVACLVLLAAASCAESSRAAARLASEGAGSGPGAGASSAGGSGGASPRKSAFDVVVEGLVSIGLGRRWRAGGGQLVDDDRRRVPTGPNPLHNR